jgi:hypothetical protein
LRLVKARANVNGPIKLAVVSDDRPHPVPHPGRAVGRRRKSPLPGWQPGGRKRVADKGQRGAVVYRWNAALNRWTECHAVSLTLCSGRNSIFMPLYRLKWLF